MIGPNMANGKVAETRTRDAIRAAERERIGTEARGTNGGSREIGWTAIAATPRTKGEPAFTRWTRRRRRVVTTAG